MHRRTIAVGWLGIAAVCGVGAGGVPAARIAQRIARISIESPPGPPTGEPSSLLYLSDGEIYRLGEEGLDVLALASASGTGRSP